MKNYPSKINYHICGKYRAHDNSQTLDIPDIYTDFWPVPHMTRKHVRLYHIATITYTRHFVKYILCDSEVVKKAIPYVNRVVNT